MDVNTSSVIVPIAHIENDFITTKGIPRQSGIIKDMKSRIIFEPEYRLPELFQGIEECRHIWLIWQFSENLKSGWNPLVNPPNSATGIKKGVFATRTPFRPNSLGISCVDLAGIEKDSNLGPVLIVEGADLMNGTPIFDIKPYVYFSDCMTDGYKHIENKNLKYILQVNFPDDLMNKVTKESRNILIDILASDPRPYSKKITEQIHRFLFGKTEIDFIVKINVLTVSNIKNLL